MTNEVLTGLTTLVSGIVTALEWFFGIFTDLISTVADQPLLLYPVGLAIVAGAVMLGFKVVRKFGLVGRRS